MFGRCAPCSEGSLRCGVAERLDLSVVVPTLGHRPDALQRLLRSVETQTRPPAETLLVVPHNVPFADVRGTRIVRAERSLPAQRKAGAEAVTAPVVLYLDDDIVLEPDFCEALLAVW